MGFSNANPPKRAGDYSRFVTSRSITVPPSTGSVVAVPTVDDWGPLDTVVLVESFAEYLAVYGQPVDPLNPSPGYIAVYNAFKGESREKPGAGGVLVYRMGSSAAAKASKNLVAGSTSPALVLTAKFEGVRGNRYKIEIVPNAASPSTKQDVNIYDANVLLESYKGYGAADIVTLQTDINRASQVVVASGAVNGTKLDALAASAMTSGNSGTTLLSADWTDAMAKYEPQQFGYFAPYDLTDTTIAASVTAWCAAKNSAEKSKRFFLVGGGAAGESYSTAVTRAAAANNENVVTFGVGTYKDTALGLNLSTSQLAPRLAGILARRGGRSSLSFAHLEDLEIVVGPSETEILTSLDQGVVVVGLGPGGVRFEKGVTTYTTKSDDDKPFETFSKIKYVTTMQGFERDNREANETGDVLGSLSVNNDTREFLIGQAQKRLDARILNKEVRPGAKVYVAADPPPDDDDEFIALEWVGKFGRSLEQVRNSFYLS